MPESLYGRQSVREALRAGRRKISAIRIARGIHVTEEIAEICHRARGCGIRIVEVSRAELDRLTATVHHQGVMAEADPYPYVKLDDILMAIKGTTAPPLVLFLDHVQDPQNLGSVLRSAEAVGVAGVLLPEDRAVHVTPAVVRVSAGATEHLHICRVTNLVRAMRRIKEEGIWIAGLDTNPNATPYSEKDLTGPLGIVVGSEAKGLGRLVKETCDFLIRVPMFGRIESLNAAVAAAVVIYEVSRQRRVAVGVGDPGQPRPTVGTRRA